jgi:hypothetical protein
LGNPLINLDKGVLQDIIGVIMVMHHSPDMPVQLRLILVCKRPEASIEKIGGLQPFYDLLLRNLILRA